MARINRKPISENAIKIKYAALKDGRKSIMFRYMVDGKRKEETLGLYLLPGDDAATAKKNEKTMAQVGVLQRKRLREVYRPVEKMTVKDVKTGGIMLSDWLELHFDSQKRKGVKDVRGMLNLSKSLELFNRDVRLVDIDKQYILDYIDFLRHCPAKKRGPVLKPKTQLTYFITLRTALNDAVRRGLMKQNPMNQLEKSEKLKVPELPRDYLTIDEIRTLTKMEYKIDIVRKAYLFGCFTGLRLSDVEKIRWSDISCQDGQYITSIVMQKTQKPIYIPLSPEAMKWLPKCKEGEEDKPIFNELPNRGNIGVHLAKIAKLAGINKSMTFHTSRHTFATMMLTLGADIYVVSKLLGHADVKTSQIYAKLVSQIKDDAVNKLNGLFTQ